MTIAAFQRRCYCFFAVLFLAAILGGPKSHTATAYTTKPTRDHEKTLMNIYNMLATDPEEFKASFAKKHRIKLCFEGMKDGKCWEGTVDEVFQPIIDIAAKWQVGGKWMSTIDDRGGLFFAVISFETRFGCKATFSASISHELNARDKIVRHYAYSDDATYFVKCFDEGQAALAAEKAEAGAEL